MFNIKPCPPPPGEKIKSIYSESFLGKRDGIVYSGAAISGIDANELFRSVEGLEKRVFESDGFVRRSNKNLLTRGGVLYE